VLIFKTYPIPPVKIKQCLLQFAQFPEQAFSLN
jgi:hypothetical protein